jgi:putative redox protein
MREKIAFISGNHKLSGLLEAPELDVKFYALFAYWFTCGKLV